KVVQAEGCVEHRYISFNGKYLVNREDRARTLMCSRIENGADKHGIRIEDNMPLSIFLDMPFSSLNKEFELTRVSGNSGRDDEYFGVRLVPRAKSRFSMIYSYIQMEVKKQSGRLDRLSFERPIVGLKMSWYFSNIHAYRPHCGDFAIPLPENFDY